MSFFAYASRALPDPVREDLVDAHRRCWDHVCAAGTWLSGAERVAIADETRRARHCSLCAERKGALTPQAVAGEHDHAGVLPAAWVDAVHRVTTDPQRLTRAWLAALLEGGMRVEEYVEAVGVSVLVISVDAFHRALGLPPEPLPPPLPGEPTRVRPQGLVEGEAWVPLVEPRPRDAAVRRQLPAPGGRIPNVLRALSLVPAEVSAWLDLSAAQYLPLEAMTAMESGRALDRSQIELLAGRVSALSECFY